MSALSLVIGWEALVVLADGRGLARAGAARGGCLVGAGDGPRSPQRSASGCRARFESGTTWTVTSLVEHGLLAFASSERYRPAEQ